MEASRATAGHWHETAKKRSNLQHKDVLYEDHVLPTEQKVFLALSSPLHT